MDRPPRVFISYSHDSPEHRERVLALADRLRSDGVDARLDQYETTPPQGWPRWMADEIEQADHVLVVVSPQYQARFRAETAGHGARFGWEGAILTRSLWEQKSFIPVVFSREDAESVPLPLRPFTLYDLSREDAYEGLYRRLTSQPRVAVPALGPRPALPTRSGQIGADPDAWTVPHQRDPRFIDRKETLAALIAVCEEGHDRQVHVVTGPKGIGKTAVLVELVYRVRSAFRAVLWFQPDDEGTLRSSLAEAVVALGLPVTETAGEAELQGDLLSWLESQRSFILVFDNLMDFDPFDRVRRIAERVGHRGLVLAASRSAPLSLWVTRYELASLDLADSLSLLTSESQPRDGDERQAAVEIAETLDGLPLAVRLAAAQIKQDISFRQYRDALLVLSEDLERSPSEDRYPAPAGLLLPALENLSGLALRLLLAASCFAPGQAIPVDVLAEAAEALPDTDLLGALERLAETSWIRLDEADGSVLGHPLILGFLRKQRWDPAVAKLAEEALCRVAARENRSGQPSEGLIRHLRFIVDQDGTRHDLRLSDLAYELAEQLRLAGRAREAESCLQRALGIREGKGRRDAETARILDRLAEAAGERGDPQEAAAYASRASRIHRRLRGDDHPDTMASIASLEDWERRSRVDGREFCELVPWGREMYARLRDEGAEARQLKTVGAGRWLLKIRIPRALQEAYGTAPEVMLLAVQGEVQGADLRRAQEELERYRFELDLDLLVVTDERPRLPERLDLMYQIEGQWVPWPVGPQGFPSLAEAFRRFLPAQDIFAQRDAVRGRQIIGRGEIINNLIRSLRKGRASGIYGLRKVGKTTVVRAVTDRLDPISALLSLPRERRESVELQESSIRAVWLDAGRCHERDLEAVASRLRRALDDRLEAEFSKGVVAQPDASGGIGSLDGRLEEALKSSAVPVVFVIDEFDLLFEGSAGQPPIPGIEKLFQMLRGHAQETGRLVLILIGRDPSLLEAPEMGGRTNPMLGWLVPHWLGPMESGDADLLLTKLGRRVGLDVGPRTLELARSWTGGHPRLHRELGSALLQVARSSETLKQRLDNGHVPTDDLRECALDQFLERDDVMTICRETFHLLDTRYPPAAALLAELASAKVEQRGQVLSSRGGWRRPENRILRDFGLVRGTSQRPEIPRFLTWYLETFEPRLRRQA